MKLKQIKALLIGATSLAAVSGTHPTLASNPYAVTVPESEIISQFHGDPTDADLRLFMAGNQFVMMDLLVDAFRAKHPEYQKIFYVTLPPGQELNWILNGGIEIHGENSLAKEGFILPVMPDVYSSVNKGHMDTLNQAGIITRYYTYSHNRLVLMARNDDPLAGGAPLDAANAYALLADPSVTISEPDILTQGIERHIWQMYTDISKVVFPDNAAVQGLNGTMFDPTKLTFDPAESLRRIVYHDKELTGATTLTSIHHLETPEALRQGTSRLGPVWVTEVLYQQNRLGKTDLVSIEIDGVGPDGRHLDRRDKVNYLATIVESTVEANNKNAAIAWVNFLRSSEAQQIMEHAGFIPATFEELNTPHIYPNSASFSRVGPY